MMNWWIVVLFAPLFELIYVVNPMMINLQLGPGFLVYAWVKHRAHHHEPADMCSQWGMMSEYVMCIF